jgi:peptidoglycan/xylan/chitin deacetylase (PgdA/CDA1 family)
MTHHRYSRVAVGFAAVLTLFSCGSPPSTAPVGTTWSAPPSTSVPPASSAPASVAPRPSSAPPAAKPVKAGLPGSLVATGTPSVALTFDDGPDPVITPKLLDLLRANRVSATFCLVGSRVKRYPKLAARIAAEGHTLCNHSWDHAEFIYKRTDARMAQDLERTSAEIHKAAPGAPIRYFRAPYGNFTPRLIGVATRLNMVPLGWDVDDQCYTSARYGTGAAMVRHMSTRVHRDTRPGSIILSHDLAKPQTLVAYKQLLPWLRGHFDLAAMPTDPPAPFPPAH